MSIARLMQMARAGVPSGGGDVWTDPDLANASYDSVSFSVAGQDTLASGLFFKPDGTKLYMCGYSSDSVHEYDLATTWDISSASLNQSFSVSSQDSAPQGFFFKPDGSKMYVVGASGDDVNEYDLSSAWDISTASYAQNFSVSTQETNPTGLFFKEDGLKMYIIGSAGDDVNEYSLSSAWDISTATYSQNFSVFLPHANPQGVFFNPDGTGMYAIFSTGDAVAEYSLSSGWDVSTASYVRDFSVASQDTNPTGVFFKSDGSKMYIVGTSNDTIYQYSTA